MAASGIDVPYATLVRKADPDFERDRRNEPEYDFTRRRFTANRAERGAYDLTSSNGVFEPNSWPSAVYVGGFELQDASLPPIPDGYAYVTMGGAYVTVGGNYLIIRIDGGTPGGGGSTPPPSDLPDLPAGFAFVTLGGGTAYLTIGGNFVIKAV